jgi:putative peptide zinc metalloprotease protein
LPAPPRPGDTQALATNQTNGGTVYKVAYAVVTVAGNAPATNNNGAYAFASCAACTTVAVSFQVVLVVGETHALAPINAAEALNRNCPVCVTTAVADQMVATLSKVPPRSLQRRLEAALRRLNLISHLGWNVNPARVAAEVLAVQQQVADLLNRSGLLAKPLPSDSPTAVGPSGPAPPQVSPPADVGAGTISPSPSDSSTSAPSQSPTPSATDTTTATASATPTDSPS